MRKKGSYIGGHTVLTQRPSDFEAELERKASRAKELASKAQELFDKSRLRKAAKTRAKLDALNQAMHEAAAERRTETSGQSPDKIRRAPKSDFVVMKISRKGTKK
jgi:hypothetical protein